MRKNIEYASRAEYLRDKKIQHNDGWRPINHRAPYKIEYIKGNEPENIIAPKRRLSERDFLNSLAENSNVEIT